MFGVVVTILWSAVYCKASIDSGTDTIIDELTCSTGGGESLMAVVDELRGAISCVGSVAHLWLRMLMSVDYAAVASMAELVGGGLNSIKD